jgi:hypothetical protein
MDNVQIISSASSNSSGICPVCHQPVLPQYYFCPNCGAKLNIVPLSTAPEAQAKLYAFSIILPWLGFLFVKKWQGAKYYKSDDPKIKQIGIIAWTLMLVSTIIVIWLAVVATQNAIKSSVDSINTDFSGF